MMFTERVHEDLNKLWDFGRPHFDAVYDNFFFLNVAQAVDFVHFETGLRVRFVCRGAVVGGHERHRRELIHAAQVGDRLGSPQLQWSGRLDLVYSGYGRSVLICRIHIEARFLISKFF